MSVCLGVICAGAVHRRWGRRCGWPLSPAVQGDPDAVQPPHGGRPGQGSGQGRPRGGGQHGQPRPASRKLASACSVRHTISMGRGRPNAAMRR